MYHYTRPCMNAAQGSVLPVDMGRLAHTYVDVGMQTFATVTGLVIHSVFAPLALAHGKTPCFQSNDRSSDPTKPTGSCVSTTPKVLILSPLPPFLQV